MCGICGVFYIGAKQNSRDIISMANNLRHRGPDDEGYLAVFTATGVTNPLGGLDSKVPYRSIESFDEPADLFLGHRRLSIIDISPAGHQPMSYHNDSLWITYNGEIYNYMDLREELVQLGHVFKTRTDTEVLLASYLEWGEDCLERLDGMWSFVIYDKVRNVLFGSCDRFGVKPLYYIYNDHHFSFASEVKAFRGIHGFNSKPRKAAVFDYIAFGSERWSDGTTFFENVRELPPAHAFCYNISKKKMTIRRYYTLPYWNDNPWEPFCNNKATQHVEHIQDLVFNSVRKRLSSDVRVGCCLSGGIDSSSIFSTICEIQKNEKLTVVGDKPLAFTACYTDMSIDESAWAKLEIDYTGGEWHTVYPDAEALMDDMRDLVITQDFPFGGTSIYAQYRVMKLAKMKGVTVLLDGQGGDELFTGYTPYYTAFFRQMLQEKAFSDLKRECNALSNASISKGGLCRELAKSVIKQCMPDRMKRLGYMNRSLLCRYISADLFDQLFEDRFELFIDSLPNEHSLNGMLSSLMNDSLPRLLRYEDRNSMRFQIESRTPFSDDIKLIEAVFALPSVYKIHGGYSKWLLRESMKPYLPEQIYLRKDKIGFATPERIWLEPNSVHFKSLFTSDLNEYLDIDKLMLDWDSIVCTQSDQIISQLWRLINVAMWIKEFGGK